VLIDVLDPKLKRRNRPGIDRTGEPIRETAGNIERRDQVELAIGHRRSLARRGLCAKRSGAVQPQGRSIADMKSRHALAAALTLAAASASAHVHSPHRTGGLGDRIAVAKRVFVIPEAVIEDSRCPTGVTCIWAGRVVLAVRVRFPDGTVPVNLTLGAPQAVGTGRLLLQQVTPERGPAEIAPQDYRFTFVYLPPPRS